MESYPYAGLPEVPPLSLSCLGFEETTPLTWRFPGDRVLRELTIVRTLLVTLRDLRDDHVSGARDLAIKALCALIGIAEHGVQFVLVEEEIVRTQGLKNYTPYYFAHRWWNFLRHVAWIICQHGRPSMGAAIDSTLTSSIEQNHLGLLDMDDMEKQSASGILFTCLRIMRRDLDYRKSDKQRELIGTHVKSLMIDYLDTHKVLDETQPTLTILTLSNSSTTLAGLLAGLDLQYQVPTTTRKTYIRFNVRIAESRPLCEGASLAKMLVERAEELGFADRLNIEIASDSSMAHLARGANFVFLGADRVSQRGAVLNKMGSYPLALCAKIVTCGKAKVAAIFERDKITTPNDTADVNEDNDWNELIASWSIKDQSICDKHLNIECRNIYFEWVPPKYIDYYVCDAGLLPKSDIKAEALWKAKVRKQVFSDMNW